MGIVWTMMIYPSAELPIHLQIAIIYESQMEIIHTTRPVPPAHTIATK